MLKVLPTLNRTVVELKLLNLIVSIANETALNRTVVELKSGGLDW